MKDLLKGRVLVVEHEPDAGLSMMGDHLDTHVQVVRPYLGESLPESVGEPADYVGLIVLGGSMGAWDDEVAPWLPTTRRLLADAVHRQVPTLGICLGAQLLAAACGGVVERGAAGLEVGLAPVTALPVAAGDPFFGPVASAVGLQWQASQYHNDAVTELPVDAELMVSGDRYRQQGFRVGSAAWGVQYHPEVSIELFAGWVANGQRSGELPADAAHLLEEARAGSAALSRLAAAHSQAFLAVIQSAARPEAEASA
ncbi:MAG TPA: type 1 glutamine amidotransferase [Kineosporiaceae bacterium]|nr:type 1 glutamine amidotransferase [Kineosporiaceae bacterium]